MLIRYDQLSTHLKKALAPVYLINGSEPFLIEESRRHIREAARAQGHAPQPALHVESGFSWQSLLTTAQELSLFDNKELIELRLSGQQFNETANKILQAYADNPAADKILLIVTDKLSSQQQKAGWYQKILHKGIVITIWPLEGAALLQWLKERLAMHSLHTSDDGLRLLAERAEGNLLAIAQEIEKLSLLYSANPITLENIAEAVHDSARFDIFQLSDAFLQGNAKRSLRILLRLKAEGAEPILILWALTKEIRTLILLAEQITQGMPLEKAFANQRIWEKQKTATRQALQRFPLNYWYGLLKRAAEIDKMVKGVRTDNIWNALASLCLANQGAKAKAI